MGRQIEPRRFLVAPEEGGQRLDVYLARQLDVSRSRAQRWIRDGWVTVEGLPEPRSSRTVSGGDTVECRLDETPAESCSRRSRARCGDLGGRAPDRPRQDAGRGGAPGGGARRSHAGQLPARPLSRDRHRRRPAPPRRRPSSRPRHLGRARSGPHRAVVPAPHARLRRARGRQALSRDRLRAPRSSRAERSTPPSPAIPRVASG